MSFAGVLVWDELAAESEVYRPERQVRGSKIEDRSRALLCRVWNCQCRGNLALKQMPEIGSLPHERTHKPDLEFPDREFRSCKS